jgi:sulfite reductase (ferredoxin)
MRITFPCEILPDDPAVARLLGIYPQRQEGLFMQRMKIPAGRISPFQLRAVARLAGQYSPSDPLHVTTRQDIELHGLKREDIPGVQRGLYDAGLSTVGACGDTVRNVTTCPGGGLCPGTFDLSGTAETIRSAVETLDWITELPRKFKISLSGCVRACARPWINDVGLFAYSDGRLSAIVAGSLGPRPATGIPFPEALAPEEVVPFVVAALRLFEAEGDRANRARARLRHVRERLGDDLFLDRLGGMFAEERSNADWPKPPPAPPPGDLKLLLRLHLPLGDIEPSAVIELADALEAVNAQLRIGFEHDLLVFGQVEPRLSPRLDALKSEPRIVACPGSTWCSRAIVDSRAAATQVRNVLPRRCALSVGISGCPNNCAQSAVANIGLVGCIRTIDGVRTECFKILVGGGEGRDASLAQERHAAIPASEVPGIITQLVELRATVSA